MKRVIVLLICISLLVCGCRELVSDPVTFYYVRKEYQEDMTDIIASEEREAAGHRDDLSYLLQLYLMGPSDAELVSPLFTGTRILSVEYADGIINLELSDTSKTMTDTEFSLACACLTLTCMDLTDASEVNIISGNRSVTMDQSNLMLFDNVTDTESTEENE